MMNLSTNGKNTLAVEVSHISNFGIWILTHNQELFMSYKDFPWFKNQTVNAIMNVVELSKGHFYWENIDVDLTEEMIKHPEKFSLTANI
jgi:hypothetical protein